MRHYKKTDFILSDNHKKICLSLKEKYRFVKGKLEKIVGFDFAPVYRSRWSTELVQVLKAVKVQEYNINNECLTYYYNDSDRDQGWKDFIARLQLDVRDFDVMMLHHAQFEKNSIKRLNP